MIVLGVIVLYLNLSPSSTFPTLARQDSSLSKGGDGSLGREHKNKKCMKKCMGHMNIVLGDEVKLN